MSYPTKELGAADAGGHFGRRRVWQKLLLGDAAWGDEFLGLQVPTFLEVHTLLK